MNAVEVSHNLLWLDLTLITCTPEKSQVNGSFLLLLPLGCSRDILKWKTGKEEKGVGRKGKEKKRQREGGRRAREEKETERGGRGEGGGGRNRKEASKDTVRIEEMERERGRRGEEKGVWDGRNWTAFMQYTYSLYRHLCGPCI